MFPSIFEIVSTQPWGEKIWNDFIQEKIYINKCEKEAQNYNWKIRTILSYKSGPPHKVTQNSSINSVTPLSSRLSMSLSCSHQPLFPWLSPDPTLLHPPSLYTYPLSTPHSGLSQSLFNIYVKLFLLFLTSLTFIPDRAFKSPLTSTLSQHYSTLMMAVFISFKTSKIH